MGRSFDKKSTQSTLGRGGSRPGAGRPLGARNKITQELKEMLAPLDEVGVTRLEKIIRHGSDKHALEGIRLAFEYRHGKPPQAQVECGEGDGSLVDTGAVLVIGGDKRSYIEGLRRARGESKNEGPPPGYVAGVVPKDTPFETGK